MKLTGTLQIDVTIENSGDLVRLLRFLSGQDAEMADVPESPKHRMAENSEKDAGPFKRIPIATLNKALDELKKEFGHEPFTTSEALQLAMRKLSLKKTALQTALEYGLKLKSVHRLRLGHYIFQDSKHGEVDPASFDGCGQHVTRLPSESSVRKLGRNLSRKHRSKLKTLENPLLYFSFVRKLNALNPDGIDEQLIDRSLEPQEALADLKRRYPHLQIYREESPDFVREFRDYMESIGINNPKIQDLVIARMESDEAFTDVELRAFANAQKEAKEEIPAISASLKR